VPSAALAALAAAAAIGTAAFVAAALARPERSLERPFDRRARRWIRGGWRDRAPQVARWLGGRHRRRHGINEALGGLTGEGPTLIGGALAAALVGRRRGTLPALPVLAAVPLGLAAHAALKYTIRRPRPLTARLTGKRTPSFPSGHAARGAAAAGMIGYAAVREGLAPAAVAVPLGLGVALVGGASRLYVDRHWVSDAVGGWGIGTAAAALCALGYEHLRARSVRTAAS
jgi:membrane-associated phospholipid phosphatase